MADPLSVTAGGVSALKAAFEVWKLLHDANRYPEPDNAKIQHLLEQLHGHIRSAQIAVYELEDENRAIRRRVDELQDQLTAAKKGQDLDDDMEYQQDGGFYIRKSERGNPVAYCPACWKKDGKTVPMETSSSKGWYKCIIHKTVFQTAENREGAMKMWAQAFAPRVRSPWET